MRSDVCLILEGTYPYVAGGVSTWVAQIIDYMPDINFSILYLAANRHEKLTLKYDLPVNVTEVQEVYLHDFPSKKGESTSWLLSDQDWEDIEYFLRSIFTGEALDVEHLYNIISKLESDDDFMQEFAYSRKAWDVAVRIYRDFVGDKGGFLDFFWSFRFINLPIMKILRTKVMPAKVYHSACTGYASTIGALFSRLTGSPLMISEHGIYTRERRIEIFDADWISVDSSVPLSLDLQRQSNYFKEWWVNLFFSLSRTSYNAATQIFSLFEANKRDQVKDGAKSDKVKIIPNGLNLSPFLSIVPHERTLNEPFVVGYVGRIAPIKDVKNLIKSLDFLKRFGVNFKALIMGPYDEDVDYYEECRELVKGLNLQDEVEFTGRVKVLDKLGDIDVGVISSISEGLPFAILEAGGAGVPFVATDVGACRELLEGRTVADKVIGPGGFVVPVSTPKALAEALRKLAESPDLARKMGANSRERVRRYYDLNEVMNEYRDEYRKCFEMVLEKGVNKRAEEDKKDVRFQRKTLQNAQDKSERILKI